MQKDYKAENKDDADWQLELLLSPDSIVLPSSTRAALNEINVQTLQGERQISVNESLLIRRRAALLTVGRAFYLPSISISKQIRWQGAGWLHLANAILQMFIQSDELERSAG